MSTIDRAAHSSAPPARDGARSVAALPLAIGAGLGVANVYYSQPVLHLVQQAFDVRPEIAGWLPTGTQLGYVAGLLLLAPLGDIIDRRRLIAAKALLLALALVASALAPGLPALIAAGIVVGLLGSVGQDFVPLAVQLAPEARRGRVVGTVMAGFLIGILCSRTLGGLVAQWLGWRAVFALAAALMALTSLAAWRGLPRVPPAVTGRYTELLRGLGQLMRQHHTLRVAMTTQALLASSLGAFWSTLALALAAPPFDLGAGPAGLFGLAGAAGALAAPLFGQFADRSGPRLAIRTGCALVIAAFALMLAAPTSLIAIGCGAALFDLGVMASMISHQTLIHGLDAAARSRLNGLIVTAAMVGVACGTALGTWSFAQFGWRGVCTVGVLAGASALARSLADRSRT
ncbi:MFS transporter [Bradyrhizobium sp. U87765 SZCCT0131]|uniref:MFS transporter n=1 Tax=unclassified Bradyrhizobium TaxID=2631580 RepID=UPI001BAA89EE|nr:MULTISPECIES: MFS transporter [unclassified Bradyrhizobium]MBR1221323.1 MFS transporter [Bradyrhizobium sp. U87765 SZCCT0131]MBR1264754.1 MFS transporter [Bradyrhizobium sp. U87765 SZCCT0134]MBR1304340.1 MFS transporter [Bradyrhizobium sp. U87765 SZCCT0110]MBR1322803.1 MFS transporter [Bradyrhizobium sp. U87765 SZCCT0109]MBR1346269.1 MFS transporter [Bradyrhizobium sp. U87765 SZCCT0048]